MEINTDITKVLKEIIKGKEFKYDILTGYYHMDNSDNSFLFEYEPTLMTCIMSNVVKDYMKFRGVYQNNLEKVLIPELSELFGKKFYDSRFQNESPLNNIKCNLLSTTLRIYTFHKDKLRITKDYFDFDKIEFVRYGLTQKEITSNFQEIDISDLEDGHYLVFAYVKGIFKGRNLGTIRIKNKIDELV